jgi:bifunctional non-homologous end joining protein LigD
MEGRQPPCADIFSIPRKHRKQGKRDIIDYLVCNNEATLLYVINLGCIDVNPWTSKVTTPFEPDYIIIDLDPSDDDFSKAIEAARAAKEFFDQHSLKAMVKTSGKTGLHLVLPCVRFSFAHARAIAENICAGVHALVPSITTTEVTVAKRGKRLFLDANQNDEADTIASPYSVRPFREPTVSTPLEWKEVKDTLDPLDFMMHTILKRLEKKGDLWIKTNDERISLENNKRLRTFL